MFTHCASTRSGFIPILCGLHGRHDGLVGCIISLIGEYKLVMASSICLVSSPVAWLSVTNTSAAGSTLRTCATKVLCTGSDRSERSCTRPRLGLASSRTQFTADHALRIATSFACLS